MAKQPEQKQIKELCEWCGQYKTCGYCEGTGRIYSSPNSYSQCRVCEGRGCFHPDLDLNNLFKFAVPKAIDKIMAEQGCSSDIAYAIIFKKWLQNLEVDIPNHEGSLFKTIWEVTHG